MHYMWQYYGTDMDSARNKVQRIRVLQHRQMIQFENEANCASTDPEIFFPKNRGGYDHMPMLKIVCGSCFAKDECLEYAVRHSVLGFWGNTTESQRRAIRRKRGIKPEPLLEREREYDDTKKEPQSVG
jgi:WhiB family redox-sensing transcriptional regulator